MELRDNDRPPDEATLGSNHMASWICSADAKHAPWNAVVHSCALNGTACQTGASPGNSNQLVLLAHSDPQIAFGCSLALPASFQGIVRGTDICGIGSIRPVACLDI